MDVNNKNMDLNKSKKGFAFSFLVFFLAIVLFAFLNLEMFGNDFTKDNVFLDSRVNHLSEEISYFKTIYLKNVVSYSFYNTLDALANYSIDSTNFAKINQNYSKFNELIKEGILNGTFEGISQDSLVGVNSKNKTLNHFLSEYEVTFNDNYKGNFSFDVLDINVYEEKPYYLSIQLLVNWSVSTKDNISSWNSLENIFISVPISDLPVPEFSYYENIIVPSKSVEYNLPDQNWSLSNFQRTINESYSSIFFEKEHKYSIGKSYLRRFLNDSQGSYKDVLGFWSFDYDCDEDMIYDSSRYNNYSLYFGNSKVIYNFNNDSIKSNNVSDLTNYNNLGILNNGVNCTRRGIFEEGCFFDGNNDFIEVSNFEKLEKELSVFAWVNINSSTVQDHQRIICAEDEYFCYYVNNDGTVEVKLNTTNIAGINDAIVFSVNVTFNVWHNIGFIYDGNVTILYLDGIKYFFEDNNEGSFKFSGDLNGFSGDLIVGGSTESNNPFYGLIDEIGIFSRVLTINEISNLFNERKIFQIDYQDSFHGKGIYFDGKDDYINLGNNSIYNFDNQEITIEAWIKLNNFSGNQIIISKGEKGNDGWHIGLEDGKIIMMSHFGEKGYTKLNPINQTNKWYHIIVNGFDDAEPIFYVNGIKMEFDGNWPRSISAIDYNLTIGKRSDINLEYFNGVIDEIKIYNRSLSKKEIMNNYLNYDSFGKGCCNYILLMNPNRFGYNDSSFKTNISYSTKIFYDYNKANIWHNISLFNLTNVTTFDESEYFYNFLFDDCIGHAFSISTYQTESNNISLDLYKLDGLDNNSCSNLVKLGIY